MFHFSKKCNLPWALIDYTDVACCPPVIERRFFAMIFAHCGKKKTETFVQIINIQKTN